MVRSPAAETQRRAGKMKGFSPCSLRLCGKITQGELIIRVHQCNPWLCFLHPSPQHPRPQESKLRFRSERRTTSPSRPCTLWSIRWRPFYRAVCNIPSRTKRAARLPEPTMGVRNIDLRSRLAANASRIELHGTNLSRILRAMIMLSTMLPAIIRRVMTANKVMRHAFIAQPHRDNRNDQAQARTKRQVSQSTARKLERKRLIREEAIPVSEGSTTIYYSINAAHPRAQNFRDHDRTVGLLIVFHHSDHRARQTQARAVQCVREARLAAIRRTILDVRAARLKSVSFETDETSSHSSQPGSPHFKVVGHRCAEADIACAELLHTVGNAQARNKSLRHPSTSFDAGLRFFGLGIHVHFELYRIDVRV
jgi:hypothetical protein